VIIPRIIRDVWLKGEERRGGIFVVLPAESGKIDISHSFPLTPLRRGRGGHCVAACDALAGMGLFGHRCIGLAMERRQGRP
jgi:hypothetical protein